MKPRRGIEGSKKRLSAGFLVRFEGGGWSEGRGGREEKTKKGSKAPDSFLEA